MSFIGLNVENVKNDLNKFVIQGKRLYLSLAYKTESGEKNEKVRKNLEKDGVDGKKLPIFEMEYEVWYSEALQYIKTFIPDRTNDFILLYKNEKRKELNNASYTVLDALIEICATRAGELSLIIGQPYPKCVSKFLYWKVL